MNHSRRNHKQAESTLIVRLSMLLVLMFGALGATQAQWSSSSGNTTTTDKVGIGTASPATILHVESSNPVITIKDGSNSGFNEKGQVVFKDADGTERLNMGLTGDTSGDAQFKLSNDKAIRFFTNAIERMTITSGNVGIGTTSPGQLLHINSASATNALAAFSVNGTTHSFWGVSGGTDNVIVGSVLGDSLFRSQGKNILFSTDSGSSIQLYLKNGGNVGIGTTTTGSKLDVNGTISATNVIAKFQDVAEWVPSSEQLAAGTVVVLDSTKSNQVTSSSTSYDTRVAGVVSEQPGIALGEKSDSKVLVATTGRVKVKVDASRGAIHIGDLLVTSDIPGVAMKSEPVNLGGVQLHRPGTLMGKALEPLEKGSGSILVLLSLQ